MCILSFWGIEQWGRKTAGKKTIPNLNIVDFSTVTISIRSNGAVFRFFFFLMRGALCFFVPSTDCIGSHLTLGKCHIAYPCFVHTFRYISAENICSATISVGWLQYIRFAFFFSLSIRRECTSHTYNTNVCVYSKWNRNQAQLKPWASSDFKHLPLKFRCAIHPNKKNIGRYSEQSVLKI